MIRILSLKKNVLIITLLFLAQTVFGWTVQSSFDGVEEHVNLFANKLSDDISFSPPNSAKFFIRQGEENTGQQQYELPTSLNEGDELWIRVYLYPSSGFDWSANPITKLLRVIVANSDGSMISYHSILATAPTNYGCGTSSTYGYMVTGSEMNSRNLCQNRNTDTEIYLTSGEWHCIELYLKVSSTNGMMRAWHNGILKQEYPDPTIPPGGYFPKQRTTDWGVHHLLGWWNGGSQQDQNIYFDDMVYTNDRPTARDGEGNYMIGPKDWGDEVELPHPPKEFSNTAQ
ncbi:hypothetical protein QUF70_06305 [Desulfobacterales bacterium HSG17]|nr:hypothetical protein [Desulfobacterales bacterium HSG17]